MALFPRTPDGLVEIAERVYVFRSCLMSNVFDDDKYRDYIKEIVTQLQDSFPDSSFMVFNFLDEVGRSRSQLRDLLSSFSNDMTVLDYPRQYKGCPLLAVEAMNHALRVGEICLGTNVQCNVLLMHCEPGCWVVLAFMLAALLLYRNLSSGEQSTLEMVYAKAPRELTQLLSPLNPMPSQMRYLRYISRRNVSASSAWPPPVAPAVILDCVILRRIPSGFNGEDGCRLILRINGKDPLLTENENPRVLFSSTPRSLYNQADCELVKIDINCDIQGDVALECISVGAGQVREEIVFRVMFNTTFIRSNALVLNRDDVDITWDAKDQFPEEFRAEVLVSEVDSTKMDDVSSENILRQLPQRLLSPSMNGSSIRKVITGQLELGPLAPPPPPPPPPSQPSAPTLLAASDAVKLSQSRPKHSGPSLSLHQSPPPPPPPPPPPSAPRFPRVVSSALYPLAPPPRRHYLKHLGEEED